MPSSLRRLDCLTAAIAIVNQLKMSPRIPLTDLVARLASADHAIAYLRQPLPEPLLDGLHRLAGRNGHGSLDLVIDGIDDVAYLKKLRLAGASVYNGTGLPQDTLVIVNREEGYWLITEANAKGDLVPADNAPDLYLKLLWRRFGLAVSYEGDLIEIHSNGFFCIGREEQRDIWCRFSEPRSNGLPSVGTRVQLFGWIKWNSQIMEVLEVAAPGGPLL